MEIVKRAAARRPLLAAPLALVAACMAGPVLAGGAPGLGGLVAMAAQQQPATDDEFVPVAELPPGDQLPAAPLLIGAYAFAWLMVAGYLFSIWRRLSAVEHEIAQVARQVETVRRT
jgi:CcmD family protein